MLKLKIRLRDLKVEKAEKFENLEGIANNGQHWQLPDYVLAEVQIGAGLGIFLYHPETEGTTGHYSLKVIYDGNFQFYRYGGDGMTIPDESTKFKTLWPTGAWNLFEIIIAIENFLNDQIGYDPQFKQWICKVAANGMRAEIKPS